MFKRKESLNFYTLLIQQAQVIRDAVEALCGKSRHQTESSDDGDKYVCPIHHKTFMAKHRNCRQSERRYEASQTPTEQRAPPFDT